jgi:hypothetical protein
LVNLERHSVFCQTGLGRWIEPCTFAGETVAGDALQALLNGVLDCAAATWELARTDHAVNLLEERPIEADCDL